MHIKRLWIFYNYDDDDDDDDDDDNYYYYFYYQYCQLQSATDLEEQPIICLTHSHSLYNASFSDMPHIQRHKSKIRRVFMTDT